VVRLAHPFPTLLNAIATGTLATLAGGDLPTALRLALSMLALQASIGALNDRVDAPRDAAGKPAKPIPAGVASRREAQAMTVGGLIAGILLSAPSGAATVAVAIGGAGLGYLYDLRLSRTPWSWLPLALALPLVPLHAWLGATGNVPPGLVTLVPTAVLAGAALAIANGLVDIERDGRADRPTIAVRLGRRRAWIVQTALLGIVGGLAIFVAPAVPPDAAGTDLGIFRALRLAGVGIGLLGLAAGALALAAGRAGVRERGWELEALGVASAGLGWLAGAAAVGAGGVAA
jgi:heme o synthase